MRSPILYLDSGGIPEYCDGFGISFVDDFENKLEEIIDSYDTLKEKLKIYPFNSNKMCEEYLDLFQNLLDANDILSNENSNYSLRGRFLILKNKFLRIFRDQLYLNFKNKLANFYRDRIKHMIDRFFKDLPEEIFNFIKSLQKIHLLIIYLQKEVLLMSASQ